MLWARFRHLIGACRCDFDRHQKISIGISMGSVDSTLTEVIHVPCLVHCFVALGCSWGDLKNVR